jgi:hypothetical protein
MENDRDEFLRKRAYRLWEEAGRPDGQHESHWQQALKELGLMDPVDTVQPSSSKTRRENRAKPDGQGASSP